LRDDLTEALLDFRAVQDYAQLVADVDKQQVQMSPQEFADLYHRGLILGEKGRLIQKVRDNVQITQRFVFQQAAQHKLDFRLQAVGIELEPPTPDPKIQKLVTDMERLPPPMASGGTKLESKPAPTAPVNNAQQLKQFLQDVDGRATRSYNQTREGLLRKLPASSPSKALYQAK
jgi:hypothetical protein